MAVRSAAFLVVHLELRSVVESAASRALVAVATLVGRMVSNSAAWMVEKMAGYSVAEKVVEKVERKVELKDKHMVNLTDDETAVWMVSRMGGYMGYG